MMNLGGKEPEVLRVVLRSPHSETYELENNGAVTTMYGRSPVMQTRAAFRGFVMGLTTLLGYDLEEMYDAEAYEEGKY